MKIGTLGKLIVVSSVIGILLVAYVGIVAPPAWILSAGEIDIQVEAGVVKYWQYEWRIDRTNDALDITLKEGTEKEIDGGTAIVGKTLRIICEPAGAPYWQSSGTVKVRVPVAGSDWDVTITDSTTDFIFTFYKIDAWMASHVPYDVRIYKDGVKIGELDDAVAGEVMAWDKRTFRVGDVTIQEIGQVSRGVAQPAEPLAIMCAPNGYIRVFTYADVINRIQDAQNALNWWGTRDFQWFWDDAKLDGLVRHTGYERALFETHAGVPANIAQLTKSLVIDGTWSTNSTGLSGWTWREVRTSAYAFMNMPAGSLVTDVSVIIPADLVETWVYVPPWGKPRIVEFPNVTVSEGQTATVWAKVHNEGTSKDTFTAFLTGSGFSVAGETGAIDIAVCNYGVFQWQITGGQIAADTTYTIRVEVEASSSGYSDSATAILTVLDVPEPNGPTPGSGGVKGRVIDQEGPLSGVFVEAVGRGITSMTFSDGKFELRDIPEGHSTVRFSLEGYQTLERSVFVTKDATVDLGDITMSKWLGVGIPWELIIAIGVAGALAAVCGVWWVRRK